MAAGRHSSALCGLVRGKKKKKKREKEEEDEKTQRNGQNLEEVRKKNKGIYNKKI